MGLLASNVIGKSGLYLCCEDRRNRVAQYLDDEKYEVCRACGRRHYDINVDPGVIGIYGAGQG